MTFTFAAMFLFAPMVTAAGADAAPQILVERSASGDVRASVTAQVNPCGITAVGQAPSFRIEGTTIEVKQPVAGIACMNPPPTTRAYRQSVDFGKLAPGRYVIHWSFPDLSTTYTVPAR